MTVQQCETYTVLLDHPVLFPNEYTPFGPLQAMFHDLPLEVLMAVLQGNGTTDSEICVLCFKGMVLQTVKYVSKS